MFGPGKTRVPRRIGRLAASRRTALARDEGFATKDRMSIRSTRVQSPVQLIRFAEKVSGIMLVLVATMIAMLLVMLVPVLVPAVITRSHTIARR